MNAAALRGLCGARVVLPGPVPGLGALESSGSSRAGSSRYATVVAAKGGYLVSLSWSVATPEANVAYAPALPSTGGMAALVQVALARVPGEAAPHRDPMNP